MRAHRTNRRRGNGGTFNYSYHRALLVNKYTLLLALLILSEIRIHTFSLTLDRIPANVHTRPECAILSSALLPFLSFSFPCRIS